MSYRGLILKKDLLPKDSQNNTKAIQTPEERLNKQKRQYAMKSGKLSVANKSDKSICFCGICNMEKVMILRFCGVR